MIVNLEDWRPVLLVFSLFYVENRDILFLRTRIVRKKALYMRYIVNFICCNANSNSDYPSYFFRDCSFFLIGSSRVVGPQTTLAGVARVHESFTGS
ncbi:hypothetical protein L915_08819 [Phytophthora nicotianae]|uniref:Uncharacterized protein n=1 Tax=Phytophthora nicotianae TaxID=4792 RepID=W2GW97_PHYNI|nr:hypothetical protein L915_08819 [Phytophthora nicotianae]